MGHDEIEFDPVAIRHIGSVVCPAIAESYEALASSARSGSVFADDLFGMHANSEVYAELFDLFKTAVDQTPVSLRAFGATMVAAADRYDVNEQDIVLDLQQVFDGFEEDFEDHRSDITAEHEAEAQAAAEQARENADNKTDAHEII